MDIGAGEAVSPRVLDGEARGTLLTDCGTTRTVIAVSHRAGLTISTINPVPVFAGTASRGISGAVKAASLGGTGTASPTINPVTLCTGCAGAVVRALFTVADGRASRTGFHGCCVVASGTGPASILVVAAHTVWGTGGADVIWREIALVARTTAGFRTTGLATNWARLTAQSVWGWVEPRVTILAHNQAILIDGEG